MLGRPITTATDIYALGVLLYQLLTGRSPYRLLSYSQLQLERAICMDDPVRPSQMVVAKLNGETDADRSRISDRRGLSPQRLRARLSGDLDAIVAMAMRKEPDRRYPSVEALADDLNRHLLGQPVRARQGDWRYNTAKFLRRQCLARSPASRPYSSALALIAGVTLWQNHRIELARDATAQERDRAQQVSAFLVDVFSQADPFNAQGQEATAKDLLDRGAEKITGNLNLQPEVRAQLLESIGLAYRRQGLSERAIPLVRAGGRHPPRGAPARQRTLAAALANLARALTDAGHLVGAEAYLQQAVALSQSGDAPPSVETADILVQYGHFALNAKSDPGTRHEAVHPGARHLSQRSRRSASADRLDLERSRRRRACGRAITCMAEQYEREAIKMFQATVSRNYPDHAVALATLGYILTQRGKYAEAEQVLNEALQIERNVFGPDNQRIALDRSRSRRLVRARRRPAPRHGGDPGRVENHDRAAWVQSLHDRILSGCARQSVSERQAIWTPQKRRAPSARHLRQVAAGAAFVCSLDATTARRSAVAPRPTERQPKRSCAPRSILTLALAGPGNWRTARTEASLGWMLIAEDKAAEGEPMLVAARAKLLDDVGPATSRNRAGNLAPGRLLPRASPRCRRCAGSCGRQTPVKIH